MRLLVVSHKPCWFSASSPSGYATDGGFPFQMHALSELFESTTLVVPCSSTGNAVGEVPLTGQNVSITPLTTPSGSGLRRKLNLLFWLASNGPILIREIYRADAVHTPIPSDIGTIGMLLAFILRKPLLVRHCANWHVQSTVAEHFWKWFMERFAGGKSVMLATGGATDPPSQRNSAIRWIFSTSMSEQELEACLTTRNPPPPERARLIIVCRQEEGKGTEVVIKSLQLILKHFPGTTLDVVGEGNALVEFKNLAVNLGVHDRVNFHGKVNHATVLLLLKQADLFCFPTSSEGFPKAVLEALACGLPVITTRVSVLPQLVEGCGILIEEITPVAVAQAVQECLSNAEHYVAMSARALTTARRYSLERWRDNIGDLLQTHWGALKSNV